MVRHQKHVKDIHSITAGIAQGSILTSLLYLISTANMPISVQATTDFPTTLWLQDPKLACKTL